VLDNKEVFAVSMDSVMASCCDGVAIIWDGMTQQAVVAKP
jgi:hypothetical protein